MEKVKLVDICRPKQWKTISMSDLKDEGYPVYGANGIIGYYDEYTHEEPTILITCRGATCGTINISIPKSYVNGNAMALDNLSPDCNLNYLAYALKKRGLNDIISGSAQPQITREGLAKVEISLPSLSIQKSIAVHLGKADELIRYNRQLIEKYNELQQSLFLDMFGDPVVNEKGWEKMKFGKLGEFKNGLNYSVDETGEKIKILGVGDFKGFWKLDKISSFSDVYIKEEINESYFLQNDDLVFVRSNGNKKLVGRCVIVFPGEEKITFSGFCIRFRKKAFEINPFFLTILFSLNNYKESVFKFGRGANIQNINQEILSNIDIIIPPLSLQNEFASHISSIEYQKELVKEALAKSEDVFNGLLQEKFN